MAKKGNLAPNPGPKAGPAGHRNMPSNKMRVPPKKTKTNRKVKRVGR